MRTYDCPSCGAAVAFQSSSAVFAVCSFCRSMVVRRDLNVEAIGTMAQLPPDLSPLQVGTRGVFDGHGFLLVGRVRLAWSGGSWTEWYALFNDERTGWVAEAQGLFMVSFAVEAPDLPARHDLAPGRGVSLLGQSFSVVDIKESTCVGSEGELPFAASPGREANTVDLAGADGAFASVEFADHQARVFLGRYARFEELNFTELRPVPGWTPGAEADPKRGHTQSLACPACGAVVELRAAGLTMAAVCGSCGAIIDTANPQWKLIREAMARQTIQPLLPLGTRGQLFGREYEVIGFVKRADEWAAWFEYLLFNPWHGFGWLTTYEGHWNWVAMMTKRPRVAPRGAGNKAFDASYGGVTYALFADAEARVEYVLGEFYWKVTVGERTRVMDFVAPPRILSREDYPGLAEVTWSAGEYVDPDVVRAAFPASQPWPRRSGVYLNQPNPHAERWRRLRWMVPAVLIVLGAIAYISAARAAKEKVFEQAFVYRAGDTNRLVTTEPFEIRGGYQAVEVASRAPVDNNWLSLEIDFVNARTGERTPLEQGVEYYHGNDDGEWSEGSPEAHAVIAAVAPGSYFLQIEPSADPAVPQMSYQVSVIRDVTLWSNFWIAAVVALAYPLWVWFRKTAFERARWAQSDYSPWPSAGAEDDDD